MFGTEALTVTLSFDLTFNPMRAIVMTHIHARGQGQRSFGSKVRVEQTDGWTDRGDYLLC